MISDTLSDALQEMYRYLIDEPEVYEGDTREQLLSLMTHMHHVRKQLDTCPVEEMP